MDKGWEGNWELVTKHVLGEGGVCCMIEAINEQFCNRSAQIKKRKNTLKMR